MHAGWALLLASLVVAAAALDEPRGLAQKSSNDFPVQWFDQVLDHFNPQDTRTFRQRFYVNDLYFKSPVGPVFLYIGGEGETRGPPTLDRQHEVALLAQKYGGLILTLEHRYYGESHPFPTMDTRNLQYLTSKQAIFDLAYFRGWYQRVKLGEQNKNRWVIVGGSYAGALSAWSRIKFPHLYVGAISSSGVVNAVLDFVEFDQQVAIAVGDDCAKAMRETSKLMEKMMGSPAEGIRLRRMFNVSDTMEDGDFYYLQADAFSLPVQYGQQDSLCSPLTDALHRGGDLVAVFTDYVRTKFYPLFSPDGGMTYSTEWQQDTTVIASHNWRQWWYQTCVEVAYFQNAPSSGSIRSRNLNMTYHKTHCAKVFGMPLWPDTVTTNLYYGADEPVSSNIFFANGSQDPWQRASVQKTLSPKMPEITITCKNCGHCVDLGGCSGGCVGPDFQRARDAISAAVGVWLTE